MNRPIQQVSRKLDRSNIYAGRVRARLALTATFAVVFAGCNSVSTTTAIGTAKPIAARQTKVLAQGQILPADGLIRLAATPGDIVAEVHTKVGEPVKQDKSLITMRSLKMHEARVEALQRRLEQAKQQQADAVQQARIQITVSETKVQQATAQINALKRQEDLLALGKEQVSAAENALKRFESVANDPLTSSFAGETQLDQQRIAVGEAKLKYQQQREAYLQAQDAAKLNDVAARQVLNASLLALASAEQSLATKAIEAELKALELGLQSAYVRAPQDAVVVAVNTRVGEAAGAYPLIELADLTRVICTAEVVEGDAGLVAKDQLVQISSPALPRVLRGKVVRIARLVGRPQLAAADPLAKADYRSVSVEIEIEPADVTVAGEWLQLQVSVEIAIGEGSEDAAVTTEIVPKS